jgi:hypothetical protein
LQDVFKIQRRIENIRQFAQNEAFAEGFLQTCMLNHVGWPTILS